MPFFKFALPILAGVIAFLLMGFPAGHSASFNYPWAAQYVQAFGLDALLPRHLPGLWAGLGGYDFFFYAPLPFWLDAAVVSPLCVGCSTEAAFVLTTALIWVASSVTCYLFLRRYFGARHAVFGAIGYAVLPYHLVIDWFARQAIGEFAAYAFIPLVAFGFDALRLKEPRGWVLSLGVAGTALCHLPTALLAAHVFGVVALAMLWHKLRRQQQPGAFARRLGCRRAAADLFLLAAGGAAA